jgi:uracil-DNA glycosylase
MTETHQPPRDCPLCPRLFAFRERNREAFPDFFNAPVSSFGSIEAPLLIVGLAPGLKGANRTGRPFTGDYAGELLYGSLARHGLGRGEYNPRALACPRAGLRPDPGDGFELVGVRITNAVRCVPPENKPLPIEINTCRRFLIAEIEAMANLRCILALGQIAHQSVISMLKLKKKDHAFGHGARHEHRGLTILGSYHCSRYNTNTGVLTQAMFDAVMGEAKRAAGL